MQPFKQEAIFDIYGRIEKEWNAIRSMFAGGPGGNPKINFYQYEQNNIHSHLRVSWTDDTSSKQTTTGANSGR